MVPRQSREHGDASPLGDAIVANEAVKKKQMLLLGAGGLAALIIGSSWIFAGESKSSDASVKRQVADVSVDEMVNKNMAEKEWRAQSEAQMMSMDNNMRALAARAQRADQLEAQLAQGQAQRRARGGGIPPDTERVLSRLPERERAVEGRARRRAPVADHGPARCRPWRRPPPAPTRFTGGRARPATRLRPAHLPDKQRWPQPGLPGGAGKRGQPGLVQ
jgi:conjugal transfer pilus assembly protein TraB